MRCSSKYAMALLFAAVTAFWCLMSAAQAPSGESKESEAQEHAQGHDIMQGDRAGKHLDWLSKELNLTDDQKAKLQPILEQKDKEMQAVRSDSSQSPDQKRAKMKQIHQSYESQIQAVLTPEQRQKLAQEKAEHKGQHKGMGDKDKDDTK